MSVENRKFRNIKIMWKLCRHFLSSPRKFAFHSLEMFFRLSLYIHTRPDFSWCLVFDIWDLCLWRKIVKDKQQDANCLQIYSTGLILLAKLCCSWNDLIHHLSDYLPPLPMGTCTNHVDQKTKCEGPFLPFLRGSSLGLHDHKKVRGSNIYYEMLNHGERGALFDLWGCAIVPYNPQ